LLYLRIAATAAVVLSLGGCSFFGFWGTPEAPTFPEAPKFNNSDTVSPASPSRASQLAALPDYLSDEDLLPAVAESSPGYLGVLPPRPSVAPAWPVPRKLYLTDFLPQRKTLDIEPIPAALNGQSITLADLMVDQAWRKRTSQQLERLFQ
jgi:hypothetical protein